MSHHAEIEFRHPRATSNYTPSTFLERGVAVPFTTPLLGGARLRPGDRDTLELIVANPSGGRGVYIVAWSSVAAFCTPTLHDRTLYDRIRAQAVLAPATIRRLALDVARQGLAGRQAAAAAATALALQERLQTVTNFELLQLLVQQVAGAAGLPAGAADLEQRGRRAVTTMASRFGRSPEVIAAKLEDMAAAFLTLGVGDTMPQARIPAAMAAMTTMCAGVRAALTLPPAVGNPDAGLLIGAAELTLGHVRRLADEAAALLLDLPSLLRAWIKEPDRIAARVLRPEWLLDGWERIWLLWQDEPRRSEALLTEMADLIPATPREAVDWLPGLAEGAAGIMRNRRTPGGSDEWRNGEAVQERVARNERLQARALHLA